MATKKASVENVTITKPDIPTVTFKIRGTAPLVINKFSQKALEAIKRDQEEGSSAKNRKKKEPKDFDAIYEGAKHVSNEGWCGIPATAFRNGMISACRVAGYPMTRAKLSIFTEADGFDKEDFSPLVKITKGEPHCHVMPVRLPNGSMDIAARPMWKPGWEADVTVRYDRGQFNLESITNLLMRVGMQVGICCGRPDSKDSGGMGWGLFDVLGEENE